MNTKMVAWDTGGGTCYAVSGCVFPPFVFAASCFAAATLGRTNLADPFCTSGMMGADDVLDLETPTQQFSGQRERQERFPGGAAGTGKSEHFPDIYCRF
jgi:hypothetical protein